MTTQDDNAQVFAQDLLAAVTDAEDGHLKQASTSGTKMIRRKIREQAFCRNILDFNEVEDSQLTMFPDTELPVVVEEMEPDAPAAKSVSFDDQGDTQFYRGTKFVVYFHKITTDEFTKNKEELRTYRSDLRSVMSNLVLRSIDTQEDQYFIDAIDTICGSAGGVGAYGSAQHFELAGQSGHIYKRTDYVPVLSYLEDRDLNNGVFLMNRKTAKDFLTWDRNEMGGDLAERIAIDGASALDKGTILGVQHLFTIKRNMVPDGRVYQFAPQNFLGVAYELDKLRMYVKKEKDVISFSAEEKIGMTIANVAGCNIVQFTADAS